MWLLRHENDERLIYLKPNATMTVGRNKGDIVLAEDHSISRVHAQIIVETSPDFDKITDKTQPLSKCTIKDSGSKYGNFLLKNNVPLRISEEGLKLQHMDRIRFGLQNNIFNVYYIPTLTVTTGMSEVEKEELKKMIDAIDGKIIYDWTHLCTHMTVVKPKMTEKLSCALATATPIVSLDYWNSVTKAFNENKDLPDTADFCSSIDNQMQEIGNVSVRPNSARKKLFQNRTFVHFNNKQYHLYKRIIKYAGGKSIHYGKQQPLPDVSDDNVIVVQLVESNTTQATGTGDANYAAVCEKLRESRRRPIPDSEIAIALMHCSMTRYCNPKYDYAVLFASRTNENPLQDMTVLAVDTQDMLGPSTSRQNQINRPTNAALYVPETVQESCDMEFQPAKKHRKNLSDSAEIADAKCSESVEHFSTEDSPTESEIGSIKLASLNYEDHLREEFNRKTTIGEESIKRHRDSEDDKSPERNKKTCLGISSIDKAKERDYKELMPDDDDDFLYDAPVKNLAKKQASLHDEGSMKKEFDKSSIDEIAAKRDRDRNVDRSESIKNKNYHGQSSIDKTNKRDYKDKMMDDDDAFLLDEPVHVAKKDMEKHQELRTSAKILATGKNLEELEMSNRRKSMKFVDSVENDDEKTTDKIDNYRNPRFETEKTKPSEYSTTDKQEKSSKRKVGRSDISPFSDLIEIPRKRNKSEIANERQIDNLMKKSSAVKTPLMDLPSASTNSYKTEIKKEADWIINTLIEHGSEENTSGASDLAQTSLDRSYDTTNFIKFRNDPTATLHPILRINQLSDIQTKKFGKCFRKQKIKIPVRIELDASMYGSRNGKNKKAKARLSMDDDDWEKRQTSHEVIPDIFSRAKKICRV